MNDNCTLFLSTYDGGEDCWKYFFESIKKQWPEMNLPVVINTESKGYEYPGFQIETFHLYNKKQRTSWGSRLIENLMLVKTDYILFFLEDNWLSEPVNDLLFRRTLSYMEENSDIACFTFRSIYDSKHPNIDDGRFDEYELRPQICEYRLNAQVALWRREKLIEFTRKHESPWEWEIFGSERAHRYKEKFYVLKKGIKLPFEYIGKFPNLKYVCDGMIANGKWDKYMVDKYSAIYDLSEIEFEKRGFEYWESYDAPVKPLIVRIINKFLIKPYRHWLSTKKKG